MCVGEARPQAEPGLNGGGVSENTGRSWGRKCLKGSIVVWRGGGEYQRGEIPNYLLNLFNFVSCLRSYVI